MTYTRSLQASAAAGVVLAAGSTITAAPLWLWATWAALTALSVRQATRTA